MIGAVLQRPRGGTDTAAWRLPTRCAPPAPYAVLQRDGFVVVGRAGMLMLAVLLFVVALIAGALGFTGLAVGTAQIAQLLFVVFLVLAIGGFVVDLVRRRRGRRAGPR